MRTLALVTLIVSLSGCAVSAAQSPHRAGVSPAATRIICHGCDGPHRDLTGARSPAAIIERYYRNINARAFRRAYAELATNGRPPFASWKAGYSALRWVDLRDLVGMTYRIARGSSTYTCAGTMIFARNRTGPQVRYGGFYMLAESRARSQIVLPGSRIRRGGQLIEPSRVTCAAALPPISSAVPKEILEVSFIDPSHGWLLGLPCGGENACYRLTIAVTSNGGSTWTSRTSIHAGLGYTAYPAYAQPAANRARSIRFADPRDGWVYGPALYATHDGGRSWKHIVLKGLISDVIPVGHSVWAVDTRCHGTKCSTTLIRSNVSGNAWHPLPHQPVRSGAPIQLNRVDATHSWLLYQARPFGMALPRLVATADGGATWFALSFPCQREFGFAVRMAVSDDRNLYMVCAGQPGAGQQFKEAFHSTDGGRHWSPVSSSGGGFNNLTASGYLSDLAVTGSTTAFLALGRGTLMVTRDGGRVWRPAIPQGRADPGGGGVGPLVFVNPHDGWLVSFPYYLFRTTDGGRTWQQLLGQGRMP